MVANGIKLNLYGARPAPGWQIVAPAIDAMGRITDNCENFAAFADASVDHVHAWHVLNRLKSGMQITLMKEIHRILKPGGRFTGAVPDMDMLCRLFVSLPDPLPRMAIAGIIYGDHATAETTRHYGFNAETLNINFYLGGFPQVSLCDTLAVFPEDRPTMIEGIVADLFFSVEKTDG